MGGWVSGGLVGKWYHFVAPFCKHRFAKFQLSWSSKMVPNFNVVRFQAFVLCFLSIHVCSVMKIYRVCLPFTVFHNPKPYNTNHPPQKIFKTIIQVGLIHINKLSDNFCIYSCFWTRLFDLIGLYTYLELIYLREICG